MKSVKRLMHKRRLRNMEMNYGTALINKAKKSAVGLGIKKNCAVAFAIKKLEQMLVYFWLDMTGKCQLGNGSCYQYTSKACSQALINRHTCT